VATTIDKKKPTVRPAANDAGKPDSGGRASAAGAEPRRRKLGKCVICARPQTLKYRPFCSGRCADVDLHNWVAGAYRIPTDEAPDEAALADAARAEDGAADLGGEIGYDGGRASDENSD